MKYETLEDVYSFFGLAILKEKPLRRTDIGKKENTLMRGKETKPSFCFGGDKKNHTFPLW